MSQSREKAASNSLGKENLRFTWEGCSVLLDINDGDRLVFARLSAAAKLKIGNKNCSLQPLIGCPFGSSFQVENGSNGPYLSRFLPSTQDQGNKVEERTETIVDVESKDNRTLIDNNKAQALTGEDIAAMREQGARGDEIIEALIANSTTFDKKTQFSQEKYRIKKQKKYAPKVLVRRPFSRSICEAYFKKYPFKIGSLRVDALSLLLSMANVSANSDVVVVDMVGGLLTGSVAERLGGTGHVCNAYPGAVPYSMDIVRIFNFSEEICKRIVTSPISGLLSSQQEMTEQVQQHKLGQVTENQPNDAAPSSITLEETLLSSKGEDGDLNPDDYAVPLTRACKSVKAGENASLDTINYWKENGFSSLIIAAPELDAWTLVKDLLSLLSNSAPFAIYHQYLEPLATCMHNLQTRKMAIGLQISEPWLREYQVLPCRTHPCMQMSAFGGYILSGTKICSS